MFFCFDFIIIFLRDIAVVTVTPCPNYPSLPYSVIANKKTTYQQKSLVTEPLLTQNWLPSQRPWPPQDFKFCSPRTEAWNSSFTISSHSVSSHLKIKGTRNSFLVCYLIFLYLEIKAWHAGFLVQGFTSTYTLISTRSCPALPLNLSGITYTKSYMTIQGHSFTLLFILTPNM